MSNEEELLKMDAEGVDETAVSEEVEGGKLARPADVLPGILHVLPLANRPFFPAQMVPLVVDREPWQRTVEAAVESGNNYVGLVLIRGDDPQAAGPDDFYSMGTASRIHKVVQQEDKLQLFVEGMQRFRIDSWMTRERPFAVRAQYFPETGYKDVPELKAYTVAVINTIKELLPLNPLYGEVLPPASRPRTSRNCKRCSRRRISASAWKRYWCCSRKRSRSPRRRCRSTNTWKKAWKSANGNSCCANR